MVVGSGLGPGQLCGAAHRCICVSQCWQGSLSRADDASSFRDWRSAVLALAMARGEFTRVLSLALVVAAVSQCAVLLLVHV